MLTGLTTAFTCTWEHHVCVKPLLCLSRLESERHFQLHLKLPQAQQLLYKSEWPKRNTRKA